MTDERAPVLYPLLAYDADGNVTGQADFLVRHDPATGDVIGLVDFRASEEAGADMRQFVEFPNAVGAKVFPAFIEPGRVTEYRLEKAGPAGRKHAARLVHRRTGAVLERDVIEARIAARYAEHREKQETWRSRQATLAGRGVVVNDPEPVLDVRDIIGSPSWPVRHDH